jgi:hypothetical protein
MNHQIRMMQGMGQHAAYLATLKPFPGMADPSAFARLAYHHMRLAGLSPFADNLNLNIS